MSVSRKYPDDYMKDGAADRPDGIECPKCGCKMSKVNTTRHIGSMTRRTRQCRHCGHIFITIEKI